MGCKILRRTVLKLNEITSICQVKHTKNDNF